MNYVKVESSQIAAVGYDPETQTLGLKFPPNKRQPEGAEYHYANVSPRTHQALMAAPSIGSYFGQNIKAHPEQYPYTKVEADPTQAAPPNGSGAASGMTTTQTMKSTKPSTGAAGDSDVAGTTDAPAPVTSLAVIDTLENSALFASGGVTDAQLAAGREWYLANAPKGIETEEKRTALKRFARPLQKLRTGIEARAKEFTGETKRKLAAIDTEKRRLVLLVGGIEDEVLRPLTEWEQEEESRKVRLAGIQNELAAKGQRVYMDMAEIEKAIAELEAFDVSTMQEYKVGAESAIAASLRVLKPELERRREADTNARELADLRRKQAERDEADRVAEEKRQEQARIDAAVQAKLDAALEAAKAATRQEVIAELAPLPVSTATAPAKGFGSPAAVQAAQEYTVAEHRQKIMDEAAEALMGLALTRTEAMWVVSAIADGEIPHITIAY
jgi:hypothetical protein